MNVNYGSVNYRNVSESNVTEIKKCGWIRRSCVLLTFYVPFYISFLVVGSVAISFLEQPIQDNITISLRDYLTEFKKNYSCIGDSDLEHLIVEVLKASDRGVSAIKNVTSEPNWSFGQSFFFTSTIITTIGYGHIHPLSEGGKIFCIVYAVLGIPMTFILLTALVERLLVPTIWLLNCMNTQMGHLYQPFNIRVLHLTVIGSISVSLFLLFPAILFAKLEPGWNYLDAFYYCFISLTTIGLGDYIPGDAREQTLRPLYKICITGYLLTGLTFMMLLLNLYNDIPQLNVGFFLLRRSDITTDPERMRLSSNVETSSEKYNPQNEQSVSENLKVVSRSIDSSRLEEEDISFIYDK